jgi:hypothetical protein
MKATEEAFTEACNGLGRQVAVVYLPTGDKQWFLLSSYTIHEDGCKEFRGRLANEFIESGAFTANNLFANDGKINNLIGAQMDSLLSSNERSVIYDSQTRFIIFKK